MNQNSYHHHSASPPPDDELFGWQSLYNWLGFVLRAPLRHKALAASSFLVIFGIACAAIFLVPFRYQVTATLLAGYQQASALSIPNDRPTDSPTHSARDVLLRRENLRRILEKTEFIDQYLEKRPLVVRAKDRVIDLVRRKERPRRDLEDGLLDALQERLWIDVRQEGSLAITLQWWDAELARQVVDAAQQSFMEARKSAEVEAIDEASEILGAQLQRLDDDIRAALDAFELKRAQLRVGTPAAPPRPSPRPALADPDVGRLRTELAAKERALSEMESARRQRISQLQSELVQQESVYAANHPAIAGTRRLLESVSEPDSRIASLRDEVASLQREVTRRSVGAGRNLASEPYLEAQRSLEIQDPRLEFERGQLESLLRQHADLRTRVQSVQVEREIAEAAFSRRYSVVTPAQLPRGPIKPYPFIFLGGGLLGGLAFAFFVAAGADLRRGRVVERWQVDQHLALPVLADMSRRLSD